MNEFSFEIMSDTNINMEYVYGSETFIFNLFLRDGVWTIHPFDGILIQNKELCRIVMGELLRNKYFQIMLAKEDILLSEVRTSIDLSLHTERESGIDRTSNRNRINPSLEDYIANNTIESIFSDEVHLLDTRITFFGELLKEMFMDDLGPGDPDFDMIQGLVRSYKDAKENILSLVNGPLGGSGGQRS